MFRQVMMATALMAANVAPALAEMIVVAASGDAAFHPGDRIAEGTSLQLPEGARLTFLFKSGEMKVISGPFEGNIAGDTPAAAPISTWETIKSFLGAAEQKSEVLGASRKADSSLPEQPGIWLVSIDSSGKRCARKDQLTFWRRDADDALTIALRSEAARASDLTWPAGSHTLSAPASFAATEGPLAFSAGSNLRKFDIKVLPQDLEGAAPGAVLGWLLDSGCTRQASALISRVHGGDPLE